MEGLSDRERAVLAFIGDAIQKRGYPPTVREIGESLGIRSTSTVHKTLGELEKGGFIRKDPSKRRAIEVLVGDPAAPAEAAASPQVEAVDVPVLGRIAAGKPILAQENIENTLPVPTRFLSGGHNFLLVVKGDSMIEAGIMDGDYILVHMQQTAENGDIVVAMIEDFESEATVKTFYKEKDHIRLQPENAAMDPILAKEVQVLGLVKGVFRYLN